MILYLDRASHGGQGARELGERTVTRSLDKAALVAGQTGRNQFSLEPLELGVGGFLGTLQQRRVTHNVRRQDYRQSSLNPLLGHGTS
jgi:hypothetical protein